MNCERPLYIPEQFPNFATTSWGKHVQSLQHFTGYTGIDQIEALGAELTGHPIQFGDRFSSHFLPDDLYDFLTPDFALGEVEFNVWQYMDEEGIQTQRSGFRTQIDDIIRLAYCEYRGYRPENVGLLVSWVNPATEESVFRDVSVYPHDLVIDRRAAVYKIGDIEYPYAWYGDPHMHIGLLPKFMQIDAVYDRQRNRKTALGYARQAVFDPHERTYEAYEYSYDIEEQEHDFRSHVGEKDMEAFTEEINAIFPKDTSLEGIELSVWSD